MFVSSPETSPAALLDQNDHSIHGKECISCGGIKLVNQFRRDSSYRDGVREQCYDCETAPRLSTAEHVHRVREANYGAARSQRWGKDQLDVINEEARYGRYRHHSELVRFMRDNVPSIFITPGNVIGDFAIYRTYGSPQPHLEGRDFQYLFYMPMGYMPEFSLYEFDRNDVPVREKQRGYRTILLRLVKSRLVSEDTVKEHFGEAHGEGSIHYNRQLWRWRNNSN